MEFFLFAMILIFHAMNAICKEDWDNAIFAIVLVIGFLFLPF